MEKSSISNSRSTSQSETKQESVEHKVVSEHEGEHKKARGRKQPGVQSENKFQEAVQHGQASGSFRSAGPVQSRPGANQGPEASRAPKPSAEGGQPRAGNQRRKERKKVLNPSVAEWKPISAAAASKQKQVDCCVVCAEPLVFYAVGECEHPEVCSLCLLRQRVLLRDRRCPICKTLQEKVIVALITDGEDRRSFQSFGLWGDICPPDMDHDEEAEMFFSKCSEHFESLLLLRAHICGVCFVPLPGRQALDEHLRSQHQRLYCQLCVEHRPRFLQEQELHTTHSLKKHQNGYGGHPLCKFCDQRHYDDAALFRHMNLNHQNCPLCPNRQQKYYKDSNALREHLRKDHFLCELGQCSMGEVVSAFETYQQYSSHLSTEHGTRAAASAVVNFKVKRNSGEENPGVYGNHNMMELNSAQDFPSLPAPQFQSPNYNQPWGYQAQPRNAMEDFPALSSTSTPSKAASGSTLEEELSLVRNRSHQNSNSRNKAQPERNLSEEEERKLERRKQLAEAFGVPSAQQNVPPRLRAADPLSIFEAKLSTPFYPGELLKWAKEKPRDVLSIERRLAALLEDGGGTSVSFKPMPAFERKLLHMLAVFYRLNSVSYDYEPKKYVSLIKREDSAIPSVLLSAASRQAGQKGGSAVFDLKAPRNLMQQCCVFLSITQSSYKPRDVQRFLHQCLPPQFIQSMIIWSSDTLLVELVSEAIQTRFFNSIKSQEEALPFKALQYQEMTGLPQEEPPPTDQCENMEEESGKWANSVLRGKLPKPPSQIHSLKNDVSEKPAQSSKINNHAKASGSALPPSIPKNIWETLNESDDENPAFEVKERMDHLALESYLLSQNQGQDQSNESRTSLMHNSQSSGGSSMKPDAKEFYPCYQLSEAELGWSCESCTFINQITEQFCKVCNVQRNEWNQV